MKRQELWSRETAWFRAEFVRLNAKFWGGRLPKVQIVIPRGTNWVSREGKLRVDLDARIARASRGFWAATGFWKGNRREPFILLAPLLALTDRTFRRASLLHEMAHIATPDTTDHRSRVWRREIKRLSRMGALLEVI